MFSCNAPPAFWLNNHGFYLLLQQHRGGTDTKIRVSTESWPWRRQFYHCSCRDSNPRPFDHKSGTLPLSHHHSPACVHVSHMCYCHTALLLALDGLLLLWLTLPDDLHAIWGCKLVLDGLWTYVSVGWVNAMLLSVKGGHGSAKWTQTSFI